MARRLLKRYLGILFIGVVIVPAVVLSFLAIRSISHEEAYIEKQMEGTLSAEVTHVAAVVRSELGTIQAELAGTIVIPAGDDQAGSVEQWRRASALVDIPFLLSPTYEILWPAKVEDPRMGQAPDIEARGREPVGMAAEEKHTEFLENQQAFLSDEEKTPVYENIAVAYKDEILDGRVPVDKDVAAVVGTTAGAPGTVPGKPGYEVCEGESSESAVLEAEESCEEEAGEASSHTTGASEVADRLAGVDSYTERGDRTSDQPEVSRQAAESKSRLGTASGKPDRVPLAYPGGLPGEEKPSYDTEYGVDRRAGYPGEEAMKQSAISRFVQSESIRKRVYDKAEREGQEIFFRNVGIYDVDTAGDSVETEDPGIVASARLDEVAEGPGKGSENVLGAGAPSEAASEYGEAGDLYRTAEAPGAEADPTGTDAAPESPSRGRIRSMFIAEPLSFSEIVAGGEAGIVPRIVDGRLQLLYWQRAEEGAIVGCLIDSDEVRERIIGTLPGIYSAVRILTVLDELGRPVIIPTGHEDRDWRRPFVAEEISETLPRWEIAAYLTDPDIISSRAQVATSVMWILILILFVSIVGGGVLFMRSTYAEMRLAQQKTTFVANVSHELKTPLTSIRMFAEMLRDGRQPDRNKQREYLDIMSAETERLTRLVNNVLDFSRMERGEKRYSMKAVDLTALASSVVESQRTRLEHNGFDVSFETSTGPLTVHADEEALRQAMVNLLSNAEKYSTATKQIEVSVRLEGGSAVVGVSDRGVGVPPGQADTIFEEFYRADDTLTSKVKGAGLGLTIARRILRDHSGDIRLLSRDGGGSTFEIVLPVAGGTT
jgi:signal transduction histidine kinase